MIFCNLKTGILSKQLPKRRCFFVFLIISLCCSSFSFIADSAAEENFSLDSAIKETLKSNPEWRKVHRWYSWMPGFMQTPFRPIWRDRITYEDLINDLDQKMQFPGVSNAWTMLIKARIDMLSTGVRTPVGIKIYGADLKEIEKIGLSIESTMKDIGGIFTSFIMELLVYPPIYSTWKWKYEMKYGTVDVGNLPIPELQKH